MPLLLFDSQAESPVKRKDKKAPPTWPLFHRRTEKSHRLHIERATEDRTRRVGRGRRRLTWCSRRRAPCRDSAPASPDTRPPHPGECLADGPPTGKGGIEGVTEEKDWSETSRQTRVMLCRCCTNLQKFPPRPRPTSPDIEAAVTAHLLKSASKQTPAPLPVKSASFRAECAP